MTEQVKEAFAPGAELTVTDKLRLLLDITKKISRSLDLTEVINLVMDTLGSLIPYDAAGIYVLKCSKIGAPAAKPDQPCVFQTEAVRGYDIDDLKELSLKMGEGIIGHVALKGEPVISPDVRNDPRYFNAREETRSEMVAPVISNEEVIGVFDLESDKLNAYDTDDLQVLLLLASQVAIITEKVMLRINADFLNNVFNMPGTPNPNGTTGLISMQNSYNSPRTMQLSSSGASASGPLSVANISPLSFQQKPYGLRKPRA